MEWNHLVMRAVGVLSESLCGVEVADPIHCFYLLDGGSCATAAAVQSTCTYPLMHHRSRPTVRAKATQHYHVDR